MREGVDWTCSSNALDLTPALIDTLNSTFWQNSCILEIVSSQCPFMAATSRCTTPLHTNHLSNQPLLQLISVLCAAVYA